MRYENQLKFGDAANSKLDDNWNCFVYFGGRNPLQSLSFKTWQYFFPFNCKRQCISIVYSFSTMKKALGFVFKSLTVFHFLWNVDAIPLNDNDITPQDVQPQQVHLSFAGEIRDSNSCEWSPIWKKGKSPQDLQEKLLLPGAPSTCQMPLALSSMEL